MKHLILFSSIILSTLTACDTGDAAPGCAMHLTGVQGSTAPGVRPWAAVEVTGDDCAWSAKTLRVSMYETTPAMYYHGDADLVSVEQVDKSTTCAVFEWPAWETSALNWGFLVSPAAREQSGQAVPRATWITAEQISEYVPGGLSPAWWDKVTGWKMYPVSPANTPGCQPGGGA